MAENENPEENAERGQAEPEDDPIVPFRKRMSLLFAHHYRGMISFWTFIIFIPVLLPFPGEPSIFQKYQWCAYTLCVMAVFWVTECIPLALTSFLPIVIFPLTGVMDADTTCKCYINDTVYVFLGSLMMAAAVEQSGLHKRLALFVVKSIGYSHYKLLFAMMSVTMFVSMWVTNTAATTMMVPINFALLRVFENEGLLKIYDNTVDGEVASDITTCYFCAATYSATIGGIGTLVGTATNLVFKGLFESSFSQAKEYISFPKFLAFSVPLMLILEGLCYLSLISYYFGFLRPKSARAKSVIIPPEGKAAAKEKVERTFTELGRMTFWEYMVVLLFGFAIILFFTRSPQMFQGWGDALSSVYGQDSKFIRDSAVAFFIITLLVLLPASLKFFKHFTAKVYGEEPYGPIHSVLKYDDMDEKFPWSYMFLLGGGFALSTAAKPEHSNLNGKIGDILAKLDSLPTEVIVLVVIVLTILLTNFASNVAVANVIVPIGMTLAVKIKKNPLLYNLACGFSASFCFCLPVGTPGNLVVQSAAKIPTSKMIIAGLGPTIASILVTWIAVIFWAPVIWPDLHLSFETLSWISAAHFV